MFAVNDHHTPRCASRARLSIVEREGKWEVRQADRPSSLVSFARSADATDYAVCTAVRNRVAMLEVYDDTGLLVSRRVIQNGVQVLPLAVPGAAGVRLADAAT